MSDEYRPREHDHLVEPMFGRLGAGDSQAREDERKTSAQERAGLLARWLRFLRALVRARRSSEEE